MSNKFDHPRKIIRLHGYDYSTDGAYFITMCVEDKHEILAQIVGDAAPGVPCKNNVVPFINEYISGLRVELTEIGEVVKHYIENINHVYDDVQVENYVIMPNHVHMIIVLDDNQNNFDKAEGTPRAASPTKARIPKVINRLKGLTTRKLGYSIWQRSYHDHIIRNEEEYNNICHYIDTNPQNWGKDKYYNKK